MEILVEAPGSLAWKGRTVACVLGRGGVTADKREGDGATPAGLFPLRRVLFRPDRGPAPMTALPMRALTPADGWCDDPARPEYNRPVTMPFAGHHEALWRDDGVYDLIVVLGINDEPVVAGRGSALFLHRMRPDRSPTEGCVALTGRDLRDLLADCGPDTWMRIRCPVP